MARISVLCIHTPRRGVFWNREADESYVHAKAYEQNWNPSIIYTDRLDMLGGSHTWTLVNLKYIIELTQSVANGHWGTICFFGRGSCEFARVIVGVAYSEGIPVDYTDAGNVLGSYIDKWENFCERSERFTRYDMLMTHVQ